MVCLNHRIDFVDVNQSVLVSVDADFTNEHIDSSIDDHILGIHDRVFDAFKLFLKPVDLLDGEGTAKETLERLG